MSKFSFKHNLFYNMYFILLNVFYAVHSAKQELFMDLKTKSHICFIVYIKNNKSLYMTRGSNWKKEEIGHINGWDFKLNKNYDKK